MNPANPATAVDHKIPDPRFYGAIKNGPYIGTFAKVGLSYIRRIGTTDYKRVEEPAGSGLWVWRLRESSVDMHKAEPAWDTVPPYQPRKAAKKQLTNNDE